MAQFYLLVAILFVTRVGALFAQLPEFLDSSEGITLEIERIEDEILKRRALATFLEYEADRWYFFQLTWWPDSVTNWKLAGKQYAQIELLEKEIVVLKKLLASYPSSEPRSPTP